MKSKLFGMLLGVALVGAFALAQSPSGIPSRPRFQSVGINAAAPATGKLFVTRPTTDDVSVFCRGNATVGQRCVGLSISAAGTFGIYGAGDDGTMTGTPILNGTRTGPGTWSNVQLNGVNACLQDGTNCPNSSGTFTAVFSDACTADQSVTVDWQRSGDIVTLSFQPAAGCTGDSVNYGTAAAPLPAALRPAQQVNSPLFIEFTNNGVNVTACVVIVPAGNLFFGNVASNLCNTGGWSAAGTRDTPNSYVVNVTYMLGNP